MQGEKILKDGPGNMKIAMIIIGSVVIAAAIGGLTNMLAIKMLFRPLHTMKLGRWRMPFTPGLIPKRHSQIAHQMGKLVEEHLLTTNSLLKNMESPAMKKELERGLYQLSQRLFYSDDNLDQLISKSFNSQSGTPPTELPSEFISKELNRNIMELIQQNWAELREKKLNELLSMNRATTDELTAHMASIIIEKGQLFLQTAEGEQFLKNSLQTTVDRLGPLGGMLSLVLPQEKLTEKIKPLIEKWLRDEETHDKLQQQLYHFWIDISEQQLKQLIQNHISEEILSSLSSVISIENYILRWLQQPLKHFFSERLQKSITGNLALFAEGIQLCLYKATPEIIKKIGVAAIVEEQVLQFSLEKLEEIIRGLARKELKAITWLGAILGGIIGLVQATFFLFFI